jgi:PII-like signaling protein
MGMSPDGKLLRIFVGESDRHEGVPLHEWIVRRARDGGIAGATVLRGLEGFGVHSHLHTAKILRLSSDLPLVIEIVDTAERIDAFLSTIDGAVGACLVTLERVDVHFPSERAADR